MLTYLEALGIAMAALLNAVLAYEETDQWKAAVLWIIAGFLDELAVGTQPRGQGLARGSIEAISPSGVS